MMEEYYYKAINNNGDTVEDKICGDSSEKLISKLEKAGLQPFYFEKIDQTDNKVKIKLRGNSASLFFNRQNSVLLFTKQLANLLQAGIQLDEALRLIIEILKESTFKNVIIDIHESLKGGKSFSNSLESFPLFFNSTYISMIKAGEESTYLPLICKRIADNMEENQRTRSFIISSMIYPSILIAVSILAVITILVFVLPKFIGMYNTYNQTLPLATLILLSISNLIKNNGLFIFLILVLISVITWFYSKSPKGKRSIDEILLKIPVLGKLNRKLAVSRITASLGILLTNGVSLMKSLRIIKNITGNSVYNNALEIVSKKVERGVTFSQSLRDTGVFPDMAVYLVAVGEQTGEMDTMLSQIGDSLTIEFKEKLEKYLKLFEPFILLLMGVIIGFIVFAMLLPVMRINTIL